MYVEDSHVIYEKLNFKNSGIDPKDPDLDLKIQMLSVYLITKAKHPEISNRTRKLKEKEKQKSPGIEPYEAVDDSLQLGNQFIRMIKDVVAVSQDIDEPLVPITKVKLRRSRSQGSSVSNNHQDKSYSQHLHHRRRKRARRSISSSTSNSKSVPAHIHESKDEIQLRKLLVDAIGIDQRKFEPGNVQPKQYRLHDAETCRWRRENIWPTSEPGLQSPAEGIHAYVELAKTISTIESSLLNALYAGQSEKSAKQYIIDVQLLTLTAGANFKVI
ncbi:MAG: hypothetical protein EZS28_034663 [Streblomastix strix]|uniref:Uncharacterized protein n=1 Tax=Streblomastix strix TaxID=222440 RepID=A0A5J4UIF1_9EUKA|nr:MAG: hypothetical protein EZS28_034663 [Streblomastix strix]